MKGILFGYAIYAVSFSYHSTLPKHLGLSVALLKQQDILSRPLEEALRRTVTHSTVKLKNTKFTAQIYEEKNVWQSADYRTIKLVHDYDGAVETVGLTSRAFLENVSEDYIWEELKFAGYAGKGSLTLGVKHLVDGSDLEDKLYWFINDPLCMNEPPEFDVRADEVRKRVGRFCKKKLTNRELSPYVAKALEKQLDFIDPLTGRRAEWYEEILSCFKEYRGILEPPITVDEWSKFFYMSSYFDSSYKKEIAAWEAAGGDELLK